jgi:hypothetical protein
MKRRMELGLDTAAEAICCGVVVGLYKAKGVASDGPLGWDADFPAEEACHAVAELIRTCPAENRGTVRDRLVQTLGDLVPQWYDMISRAAERARRPRPSPPLPRATCVNRFVRHQARFLERAKCDADESSLLCPSSAHVWSV